MVLSEVITINNFIKLDRENKDELGGKFRNLAMIANDFKVPDTLCITKELVIKEIMNKKDQYLKITSWFHELRVTSGCFLLETYDDISEVFAEIEISDNTFKAIYTSMNDYFTDCKGKKFAIRSSASHEDGNKNSYAGVYESYLNQQSKKEIRAAINGVIRSYYTYSAINERMKDGVFSPIPDINIMIQDMIDCKVAGVAFSKHPVSDYTYLIEWVEGSGDELVSGNKNAYSCTCEEDILSLDWNIQTVIKEVVKIMHELRNWFGYEVDVEWGFDGRELWVLQVRPITTTVKEAFYNQPMLHIHSLYADRNSFIGDLGSCKHIHHGYTIKRSGAYQLAQECKISFGSSLILEFNRLGLREDGAKLHNMINAWKSNKLIIDIDDHRRQIILPKSELNSFLEKTFKHTDERLYVTIILREFMKGEIGFISQLLDGKQMLIEYSDKGLLAINRGIVDCQQIVANYDGIEHIVNKGPFSTEALYRIASYTQEMNLKYKYSKIEWVLFHGEPYFIDYSLEKAQIQLHQSTTDNLRVIYSGYADGPVYHIDEKTVFEKLSISPGVSVTKTSEAITESTDIKALINRLKMYQEKPIVICEKPYAILSFLIEHVSGFVFKNGSLLCHLAILLRESKIPAIIVDMEGLSSHITRISIEHDRLIV